FESSYIPPLKRRPPTTRVMCVCIAPSLFSILNSPFSIRAAHFSLLTSSIPLPPPAPGRLQFNLHLRRLARLDLHLEHLLAEMLLPDVQLVLAGRHVGQLEGPVLAGHRVIRMRQHVRPGLHPVMRLTLE